ncbi:MAG: hypothetical protein LBT74_10555 [Acidobacteriota bacterium]|nr:hypothetical protein [Acidobacteriota bacterium]
MARIDALHSWAGRLSAPLLCLAVFCRCAVRGDAAGLNLPLAALMAGCLALATVSGRGVARRDGAAAESGAMGVALAILAGVEVVSHLRSPYQPNSFFALREAASLLLLFCFARSLLGDAAARRRLYLWMTGFGAVWAGADALRCLRSLAELRALGVGDLTAFKQYFSYGSWTTQALLLLPYPLGLLAGEAGSASPPPRDVGARRRIAPEVVAMAPPALVAVALMVGTVYSFSRGAYAALAFFLLLAGAGHAACRRAPARGPALACAAACLLALAATPVMRSVLGTASLLSTASQVRSFTARQRLLAGALQTAARVPAFGVGGGNYPLVAMAGEGVAGAGGDYVPTPLNRFAATAVEKGVAGLAAHVGALALFFSVSLRKLARGRGGCGGAPCGAAALIPLVAAVAAAVVHQMSYYPAHGDEGAAALEWVAYAVAASLPVGDGGDGGRR